MNKTQLISPNGQIGTSLLKTILETRIDQMVALTPPADKDRIQILKQIKEAPLFTQKLESFLDYMIGQMTNISVEYNKCKTELTNANEQISTSNKVIKEESASTEKLNNIAGILNVEKDKIEETLQKLISKLSDAQKEREEKKKCASLLQCSPKDIRKSIKNMLSENERLQRMITQDRSLLIRQNEELKKQMRKREHQKDLITEYFIACSKRKEGDNEYDSSDEQEPEIIHEKPLRKQKEKIEELQLMIEDIRNEAENLGAYYQKKHKKHAYM